MGRRVSSRITLFYCKLVLLKQFKRASEAIQRAFEDTAATQKGPEGLTPIEANRGCKEANPETAHHIQCDAGADR